MPKTKAKRYNAYEDAPKRPSNSVPGEVERHCPVCGAWDDCSSSTWYRKHGTGKCDSQNTRQGAGTACLPTAV